MSSPSCQAIKKSDNKVCGKPAKFNGYCGVHRSQIETKTPGVKSQADASEVSSTQSSKTKETKTNEDEIQSSKELKDTIYPESSKELKETKPPKGFKELELSPYPIKPKRDQEEKIIQGDCLEIMKTLGDRTAQIVICDPPYNIGKDFGNSSDKQPLGDYFIWCDAWIKECLRILKDNGTMFVYGFSETLALILSRIPSEINRRWLVWHYTNKTTPSLNFWQRSHESILVLWKNEYVFNRDDVRESYTEDYLTSVGKERPATKGRFSNGTQTTIYKAHPNGALPRDVIKIPTLAGGTGNERFKTSCTEAFSEFNVGDIFSHPTQKPLALCEKLLKSCQQRKQDDQSSTTTDGYVLIPFGGSGSECVACRNLGLSFVCIEVNSQYVEMINKRLSFKPDLVCHELNSVPKGKNLLKTTQSDSASATDRLLSLTASVCSGKKVVSQSEISTPIKQDEPQSPQEDKLLNQPQSPNEDDRKSPEPRNPSEDKSETKISQESETDEDE